MANPKATSFFLAIVLILGANISFSTASFPTLLTRNDWQSSKQRKIIGWSAAGPEPTYSPPSPSPSPSTFGGIKGGYWASWLVSSFPPSSIPTMYFTHVLYSFVAIDSSTYNLLITHFDDEWMGNFTATLDAKNPPAKAMLSIGGQNTAAIFSNMVSSPDNRATFINSGISTARKYGFNGLDIDWEFPQNQDDMSNLSVFLKELRDAVESEASDSGKPTLILSAAVYFAPTIILDQPPATYPGDSIANYVDFLNAMCFNYHGKWEPSVTGEHALLYDKHSNISTSNGLSTWINEAGVPPEKLVLGMPLFGRTWKLKDQNDNGIGAPANGIGPGDSNGIMWYYEIVAYNTANSSHQVYDGDTVSEFAYSGTDWIGYDGPKSVPKKVEYAKDQHLGGYFLWALGYDSNWTLSAIGRFLTSLNFVWAMAN